MTKKTLPTSNTFYKAKRSFSETELTNKESDAPTMNWSASKSTKSQTSPKFGTKKTSNELRLTYVYIPFIPFLIQLYH